MTFFNQARSAVCIAALVSGNAAFADVTAQQVWDNWKSQMAIYGEDQITIGSETNDGGVLTVTDFGINIADVNATVSANMANMTFTENGDGTVGVTYSEDYPITISSNSAPEESRFTILFKSVGNEITVSGTPEEMTYAIKAARYTVSVTEALDAGVALPIDGNLNFNDISGTFVVATSDTTRESDYDLTVASLDVLVGFQDGADQFDLSGQIADLTMTGSTTIPNDYDPAAPETMFANGFAVDLSYGTGATTFIVAANDGTGPTNVTATSSASTTTASMDKTAMAYGFSQSDLVMNVVTTQMPFPIDLTAKQLGLSMAMPMSPTDEPTDFAAKIDLVEVNTNDMIWSMADPTGALPHDPITAQLDLSGTGKLFYDLTDPAQAMELQAAAVPGELHSLTLNALNLVLGGATVTGAGGFTFDNADLTTFAGFPRPLGSIALQAKGVNGLLDKLSAMGMVPEDMMSGARMGLLMFATVVGEDDLTSELKVDEAGGVFVNGQQMR